MSDMTTRWLGRVRPGPSAALRLGTVAGVALRGGLLLAATGLVLLLSDLGRMAGAP